MNTRTRNSQGLTQAALAAALYSHSNATLAEVSSIPTAAASQKSYQMPLVCQYTGITCGALTLTTVAGYLPLLSHWKQQQVLHPMFSLELHALLTVAKNYWLRFCGFSATEAEDAALTTKQEQILQVAALALLHQLAEVRQDVPWMPTFVEVQNNWQSLLSLSYWKLNLDSQRFHFPSIRISKQEKSIDLHTYLQACWAAKKNYETTVSSRSEEEKSRAAEKALLGIVGEMAGKRPTSQKLLWKWFLANLPARYSRDADGWMWELFTAKGDDIFSFTMADIDLFEEIFLCECPTGTSVSYAFLEILRSKRKLLESHFQAFEILVPDEMVREAAAGVIPADEPVLADFPSKVKWIVAQAKWKLTHGASSKHRDAAAKRQLSTTVVPSFVPRLDHGRSRDFEVADDDLDDGDSARINAMDYVAPGSIADAMLVKEETRNQGEDE